MAKVIVTESYLENIGNAIRSKLGTQDTYSPSEMAGAISQIHGDPVLETLSATENGTYTPSSGKDGFSQAVVNVPNSYAAGDEGKVVSNGALVAQTSQNVTENGTYDTTLKNEVVVNVSGGGGGGAPIYSGTSAPASSLGNNEDLYVQYENKTAIYNHSIEIVHTYRKVNGEWTDYTTPERPDGVHIWTKSTGGDDAAMYVQEGYYDKENDTFVTTGDIVSVLYNTVQGSNYYDCAGMGHLRYGKKSGLYWDVLATTTITDGTNQYESGVSAKYWMYLTNVDFYLWKEV